ncbi:MAG: DNA polymerase III subunit alpha [Coriobacteriia bacterium]|nr:DNA polymerase III subunit alpha [Coriobacteriia bacterium]
MSSFVHLHTHTEYSMLDGAASTRSLLLRAKELDMPALAITDHGYMYGAIDFYKNAVDIGVKPIIGCEVYFTPNSRVERNGKPSLYHLLLLARNNEGYKNLMAICSEAAVNGYYYKPRVDAELLEKYSSGLIATSACLSGVIPKSFEVGAADEARRWAEYYTRVFDPGCFYLEVQEQNITTNLGVTQGQLNKAIASLGQEMGLGLVGTNDIHYLTREAAAVQDILLCIGTNANIDDPNRFKFSCDEFYMKTAEEMNAALSPYPEALSNTAAIAEQCNVEIEFGKMILPAFRVPEGDTEATYLRELCVEGLKKRYGDPLSEEILARFEHEMEVIVGKGFPAYFLIVADFTQWAKDQGIGVGPGRGSAAGSIVAYALNITDIDPLKYDLLFERFLNPERSEMPDIDMDFDDRRRQEVIEYVRQKYGEKKVSQIITFTKMQAKGAVRDVGRVMGYPYAVADKITKSIGSEIGITIEKALASNKEFKAEYESDEQTHRIVDAAKSIEGLTRGEGVHAAAVVICRDDLSNYVPVKYDTKGGAVVTQYNGPQVAEMGLLKMDFLGLRNLSVIQEAIKSIERNYGTKIVESEIPLDDKAAIDLLARGETAGVFQVESGGMQSLLKRLKPSHFTDIIAVLALYRPGPLGSGMVDDFVKRKNGEKKITYYDDRLKPLLEETYGTIVYQEQVMRVSMLMCGFSAAKADKLRKAMAKKKLDLLETFEKAWVEGAKENGFDPKMAEKMWLDILPFSAYAFNKSHSAAYGVITMRTAYLKAHWPLEAMAAVLTSYIGSKDKIVGYLNKCKKENIAVLPPDVNSSFSAFTPIPDVGIRFGLAGISGVGEAAVEAIIAAREEGGEFKSLHDFAERINSRSVNRKAIEALIKAGAFDTTGYPRRQLFEQLDEGGILEAASKRQKDRDAGQLSMFDLFGDDDSGFSEEVPEPESFDWDKRIKLSFEKEMLGVYVSDHPLREIEAVINSQADYSLDQIDDIETGRTYRFAGMLTGVSVRPTKRGAMMATCQLEDLGGSIEAVIFPKTLEKCRGLIVEDAVVLLRAKVESDDRGVKLMVQEVKAFDGARFADIPKRIIVKASTTIVGQDIFKNDFKRGLLAYPGRDIVELHLLDEKEDRTIVVTMEEHVNSKAEGLFAELTFIFGSGSVGVR